MVGFILQIYIVILEIGMLTSSTGCPIFQLVHSRHKSCYFPKDCVDDAACKSNQKCCENPCGISKCYELDQDPLGNIEKCPIINEGIGCEQKKTKFCYANDCNRCCMHKNKCNPAVSLLTKAETCYDEICSRYKCKNQGEMCLVSESSHKPYCICREKCTSERNYICATNGRYNKTFLNECYMDKKACDEKKKWTFSYEGICVVLSTKLVRPIQPPVIKILNGPHNLSSSITVFCYGDRERVRLKWIQKRLNGDEIKIPRSMLIDSGSYEIKGWKRKVFGLRIMSIGYGSYGTYICQQYFNKTWLQDSFNLQPPDHVIFNRTSCSLTPDRGVCYAQFSNYFFNAEKQKCQMMTYSGCGGNQNNFQTLEECQFHCAGKLPKTGQTYFVHRGEKCGRKRCEFFATCKQEGNNNTSCECPPDCSLEVKKVCGSDGKTYPSICFLKTIACRWRESLIALYYGDCVKKTTKPTGDLNVPTTTALAVTTSLVPNKIKNLCEFKVCPPYAGCFNNVFTRAPQCFCPSTCSFLPRLVCASNMRTYPNRCFMEVASCRMNMKLTVRYRGICVFSNFYRKAKT